MINKILSFLLFISVISFFSSCEKTDEKKEESGAKPEAAVKTHVQGESPNANVPRIPRPPQAGKCPHGKEGGCPHAHAHHGETHGQQGHVHGKGCSHGHEHKHADGCANCEGCKDGDCKNCEGCKDGDCKNCEGCKQ